jgi:hypothetical protein
MKITKTQLRKIIKEEILKEAGGLPGRHFGESRADLADLGEVTYVEAIPERGASGLYKLELVSKKGKKKELRSIGEFNEEFGTDIKTIAGPRSFGDALRLLAPHVEFFEVEMDVS